MPPAGNRPQDPYNSFRFKVEIEGIQTASFTDATIPNSSTDAVPYREGTDPPFSRQLSAGPVTYGTLTLKKGVTDSMDLYNWRQTVQDQGASAARRNISIILMDDGGNDSVTWNVFDAWPSRYETSDLSASGSDVYVETLEITIERIERVQ